MRTELQRAGDAAEAYVASRLEAAGWQILGRQVRLGRDELDIVAVEPAPPSLVIVEVRWRRSRAFGLPEETFDWRKANHLRRACLRLVAEGLPSVALPHLPLRVDLVVVEPGQLHSTGSTRDSAHLAEPRVRHYRDVLAG
jgi:putative endonuclease